MNKEENNGLMIFLLLKVISIWMTLNGNESHDKKHLSILYINSLVIS